MIRKSWVRTLVRSDLGVHSRSVQVGLYLIYYYMVSLIYEDGKCVEHAGKTSIHVSYFYEIEHDIKLYTSWEVLGRTGFESLWGRIQWQCLWCV